MTRICRIASYLMVMLILLSPFAFAATPDNQDKETQQAISYLIEAVANSHLIFIRNGEKHSSDEAARHMMDKYKYFKSQIKNPEDFIRLCASRSFLSGKPYLVETAQGVIPTEKWLMQILTQYRKGKRSSKSF